MDLPRLCLLLIVSTVYLHGHHPHLCGTFFLNPDEIGTIISWLFAASTSSLTIAIFILVYETILSKKLMHFMTKVLSHTHIRQIHIKPIKIPLVGLGVQLLGVSSVFGGFSGISAFPATLIHQYF